VNVQDLPAVNASLNGLATVFLLLGYVFIKTERKAQHGLMMGAAFVTSCVFLITYVLHKILVKGVHTPFGGDGAIKAVYFVILISHIILAIVIVPLALMSMSRALKQNYEAHRRISRWTWPIWMYVSVTGVLVYFMLYVWFPHTPAVAAL
jgi:putative membrane protein